MTNETDLKRSLLEDKKVSSFQELTLIAKELMETAGPGMINNCALYSSSFVCGVFISQLGIEYIAATSYANRFRWMFMTIPSYFFWATQNSLKKAFKKIDGDNDLPPSLTISAALVLSLPMMATSMILLSQSKNISLLSQFFLYPHK